MAADASYSPAGTGTPNLNENSLFRHKIAWVDGATAGTIPTEEIPINNGSAGHIASIGVKFGATAPNTVTVTISDDAGIPIAAGTVTASGLVDLTTPIPYPVPYVGVLTVAHSGNTTVNALGDTYIITF